MNNQTTSIIQKGDIWTKLLSAYLFREGIGEIVITRADVERFLGDASNPVLVVQDLPDGIHIQQLPAAEAMELAKQKKAGGFGKS